MSKTIYSAMARASLFRFVALDEIFEKAMETAVFALIVGGARKGPWAFADADFQGWAIEFLQGRLV